MKTCDLHCHSYYSDGSFSPAQLVRMAEEKGLSALALTDHNTSKGLREFVDAGEKRGVIVVPGCEFSTDFEGTELHVVGLFFKEESWSEIEDYVELAKIAKRNSNRKLIEALRADGYDVTYEEAASLTDADTFNRTHVARILVAKGQLESVASGFQTILKEGNGYYVPARRLGAYLTIRFIKSYGGVAVLAHPFLNLSYDRLLDFLPVAKAEGLDAIETLYSTFDEETTARAFELAGRFDFKPSGGSDFHGIAKPDIKLGSGRGNLSVPFEFYEALRP